jgi:hypothetical protein
MIWGIYPHFRKPPSDLEVISNPQKEKTGSEDITGMHPLPSTYLVSVQRKSCFCGLEDILQQTFKSLTII